MSKLQWFPRYRNTLPEMKWEQQQRVDEINRLYEYLAPRVGKTQRQGILAGDVTSDSFSSGYSPFTIGQNLGLIDISINDALIAGIRSPEGITTFGEMGTANEQFGSRTAPPLDWKSDTNTINWSSSYTTASGWINVCVLPKMDQYQLDTENTLYLDGVGTDTTFNKVVTKAGDIISPYIESSPVGGDLGSNFKFYWSTEEPVGVKQIPDGYDFESELLTIQGTAKQRVKYNEVAIWIGAIKYNAGSYAEVVYNLIPYQPHLGSEILTYDPGVAGETGDYTTDTTTMQGALDVIQTRFDHLRSEYLAMEDQLSATPGVVHITKSTGDLTSYGYTENINFRSAIGKRWDK